MSEEKTTEQILAEAAQATQANAEARPKKERVKKGSSTDGAAGAAGGEGKAEKPAREPRVAKPKKEYQQANEDGTAKVDELGHPVMGPYATRYKEPKPAKAPRVDADGNPLPPRERTVFLDSQVIKRTDKVPTYREGTKRAQMYAAATDGITVGEFYAATGGKAVAATFLIWFVTQDGTLEVGGNDA